MGRTQCRHRENVCWYRRTTTSKLHIFDISNKTTPDLIRSHPIILTYSIHQWIGKVKFTGNQFVFLSFFPIYSLKNWPFLGICPVRYSWFRPNLAKTEIPTLGKPRSHGWFLFPLRKFSPRRCWFKNPRSKSHRFTILNCELFSNGDSVSAELKNFTISFTIDFLDCKTGTSVLLELASCSKTSRAWCRTGEMMCTNIFH